MVEIKWLYKSGDWKKIVKQINDDIQSYPTHPACESLIFVVMDSAKDVADPAKMERDLSGKQVIANRAISVQVYIREP